MHSERLNRGVFCKISSGSRIDTIIFSLYYASLMKQFILSILRALAIRVLARHQPRIVAVTGTVGKSTTAHFLYDTLTMMYGIDKVGVSKHNYNGEYGVPLTILQCVSPHSNPFLWIAVFAR